MQRGSDLVRSFGDRSQRLYIKLSATQLTSPRRPDPRSVAAVLRYMLKSHEANSGFAISVRTESGEVGKLCQCSINGRFSKTFVHTPE